MGRENFIEVDRISFSYTREQGEIEEAALDEVSLSISSGEFIAVVGHNGSGKSTLAKHLNGLLVPAGGDVWVAGMNTKDEAHLWDIRQTVGMVFQNPDNQIVAATVEEDVAFGPENLGLEQELIRARVDEALAIVGMSEYAKAAPHSLSGGQKQRVAIAGVIAMRPQCLVLDEPTAMLDPVGRREVLDTIKELNEKEGITVVLITHFMDEAALASRVMVMDDGRIVKEGPPRTVFQEVALLRELRLDVPPIIELASRLRARSVRLPEGILTVDEMVTTLCQLRSGA
ncbi:MAG: energy-coupling factor transporter ATPase [Firmicutes bacterium]|jgi:energy-coupling factor transport system ATP-binding protein|nr:energy-coupling factor transporter ATPase [Bacillota bacterium]